jgi:hypothetical protein
MDKTFLKSKEDFDSFVNENTGNIQGHGIVKRAFWFEPEKYPCVAVWEIEYDGDGPDILRGEFVYLDDFTI